MTNKTPLDIQISNTAFLAADELLSRLDDSEINSLGQVLRKLEKEVILNLLILCGDNQSRVARTSGLSRTALLYKLKQYQIPDGRGTNG